MLYNFLLPTSSRARAPQRPSEQLGASSPPGTAWACILFGWLAGCGAASDGPGVTVELRNNSQFTLQHLFVYADDLTYQDVESVLAEPLAPGGSVVAAFAPGDRFRVTVTRVKHRDGPLRAFTTIPALEAFGAMAVEYLDSGFRTFIPESEVE